MKRIIGIALSLAMLAALIPAVMAADKITAEDVKNILYEGSLINNAHDYELYQEGLAMEDRLATEIDGFLNPSTAYHFYSIKDEAINAPLPFAEQAKINGIKASLLGEYNDGEVAYIYKNKTNNHEFGYMYAEEDIQGAVLGWSRQTITLDASFLLFDYETLARIINENNLKDVKEIILFENNLYDYQTVNVLDYNLILIETADSEYIITDIQYNNETNKLINYTLLDKEAFTDALQDNYDKAKEIGYNTLQIITPPVFSDVKNDTSVDLLSRLGIISGYEDGTFHPDNPVTRAEAARMLSIMSEDEERSIISQYANEDDFYNCFSDIDNTHWAYPHIKNGYYEGYISGKESTGQKQISAYMGLKQNENGEWVKEYQDRIIDTYAFCPDDLVTEQELVKMLVSVTDIFGDKMASAEGGYPDGYIAVAKRLGICESASDKPATRLTAARMIKNALDAEVNTEISHNASFIDKGDKRGKLKTAETVYGKQTYYNSRFAAKQIRLTGKITNSLRDNEYKFVACEGIQSYVGNYEAGDEMTLLSLYGDLDEYVGKDCTVYCTQRGGNLVAIMAE